MKGINEGRAISICALQRYFFYSVYRQVNGSNPTASYFLEFLASAPKTWNCGKLVGRFKVQGLTLHQLRLQVIFPKMCIVYSPRSSAMQLFN